jgi:rRNA maturation endonuclease Nob1
MFRFFCENCSFQTNDETMPDCPICGGYLREASNEELKVPKADEKGDTMEMEDETFFGLNIE